MLSSLGTTSLAFSPSFLIYFYCTCPSSLILTLTSHFSAPLLVWLLLITLPLGGFVFHGMAASPFVLSTYIRTTLREKWDGGHKNVPWWLLMVNNSINDEKSTENMERRRGGKKKVERTPTKKIGTKKTYSEENILWSVCICGGWASFFFFFFFLLVLQNNLIVLLQY